VEGIAWPALPGAAGEALVCLLYQFERSQWWPETALRAAQWRQLRILLRHARRHCPGYRHRLPAEPDPAGWREIPVLTRQQLQQEAASLRSEAPPEAHGRRLRFATTGSTSRPVEVERSELALLMAEAMVVRDHLWHQRDLGGKLAVITTKVGQGEHSEWGGAVSSAFITGPAATLDIRAEPAAQLSWLRRQQPAYLLSHPSNIDSLARLSLERGEHLPGLRGVRSFGEALPEGLRERVRRAWGVPLADTYSCEEAGTIALQCPQHARYHCMAEHLLVEVVDEAGQPCGPGEWGRVLLTTLHNYAMPLIRYEIGDYAELGAPCPCGRGLPVLRRILGRRRNMLVTPDGRRHWPSFPARIWLRHRVIR
ncbi:MAG: phenylacetate--CoA ligase family protein, partial [Acidobacteriota bacterium]|nr:phenylacetate--CoA ligase family protein [Acidobacteriota bacterium]